MVAVVNFLEFMRPSKNYSKQRTSYLGLDMASGVDANSEMAVITCQEI